MEAVETLLRKSSANRRNAIDKLTDNRVTHGNTPLQEPKKLKHLHMEIYRLMVESPAKKQKQIAAELGVTPATVGIVSRSDMFQELLITHNNEVVSTLTHSLIEKTEEVQNMALDQLSDTLNQTRVEPSLALDIIHKLGKQTSDIPIAAMPINSQTNIFVGNPEILNKAKNILTSKHLVTPQLDAGIPVLDEVIGGGSIVNGSVSTE